MSTLRVDPGITPRLASEASGWREFHLTPRGAVCGQELQEWHRVEGGFISVGMFASLMGIATIIHWGKFVHENVAFWLWAGLYFTTPFIIFAVWALNQREEAEGTPDDLVLSPGTTMIIGVLGIAAVASCIFLFLFPRTASHVWPWKLSDLTARVMGAIFALGVAGVGAFTDNRWSSARILLQVEGFMLALILVAAVRAHGEFDTSRPLTWVFGAGFLCLAITTAILYARMNWRLRPLPATPIPPREVG